MEEPSQDFKFQSALGGTLLLWGWGMMLILIAAEESRHHAALSVGWGAYVLHDLPFSLIPLALGCIFFNSVHDVQILDGQFRFRQFRDWKSVPLESLTRVRRLWGPLGVYVRIDHAGKRKRIIFSTVGYLRGLSTPPVVEFLEEACRRNVENSKSRA